jgi:PleD family two-component response regulator
VRQRIHGTLACRQRGALAQDVQARTTGNDTEIFPERFQGSFSRQCGSAQGTRMSSLNSYGNGALVLNVNDSESVRYMIRRILENAGFKVIEAANGYDALKQLRVHKPCLVVLDIKMPGIDGLEVCRHIKADESTRAIKVLHTSAVLAAPMAISFTPSSRKNSLPSPAR